MRHVWDFSPVWQYRHVIIDGMVTTLALSLVACALGALLGLFVAAPLVSRNVAMRLSATALVEGIRACPPLVLLIWTYYLVPVLFGVSFSALTTATVVFTIVFMAFAADVYRGSVIAIPKATFDSARSIGMSKRGIYRRVILPELLRRSLPTLNALAVSTLKMSSLASVIAVHELTYSAQLILIQRPRPFELYTATAAAYALLILPIVFALRWIEHQPWCSLNPTKHATYTPSGKELLT
jgi:polar amino acid transport system permease protein